MGWARANILFDRYRGMPEAGSPMEMLFIVLWRMRQEIEFQKTRTTVQSLLSQEGAESKHIQKSFEDLRASFFPFEESSKEVEIETLKKAMHKEISRGALKVTPMVDVQKTGLREKLAQGSQTLTKRRDMIRAGKLVRLDESPFEKAKKRGRPGSAS